MTIKKLFQCVTFIIAICLLLTIATNCINRTQVAKCATVAKMQQGEFHFENGICFIKTSEDWYIEYL